MPDTFFAKTETAKQFKPKKVRATPKTSKLDCEACGLYKIAVYNPKMDVHGKGGKGILIIGEAPGPEEDEHNDQWVGPVGRMLRKWLRRVDLDMEEDCWRINAANCFPGRDARNEIKAPTNKQVACCKQVKVQPAIDELKPRFILLVGNLALNSFYAGRHPGLGIGKYRGRAFPDKQTGAWIMPIFHPSFIQRKGKEETLEALWERDLLRVANRVSRNRPVVVVDPTENVVILDDLREIVSTIGYARKNAPWLVFDYEGTGLKPYAPNHKVLSVAFATRWQGDENITGYSFTLQHPDRDPVQGLEILAAWERLVTEPTLPKIAHNIKHEDMWTRWLIGQPVVDWSWCTMVNAHIADNTRGITGLKFLAAWHFGVEGYDALSKKYIEGKEETDRVSTHSHNRMLEMPVDELLLYGGCDAVLTAMEYEKQCKQIRVGEPLWEARDLFHNALLMFCDLQVQGVPVDEEYYDTKRVELEDQIEKATQALLRSREAKLFYAKEGRPVHLKSNKDLPKLLFEHLGEKPTKYTAGNNPSVDAEALGALDLPFTRKLIEIRKLEKITGTYMDQIRRESVDGWVYPGTNFNIPTTYRPSMDGPNFANTPKREPVAKELIRYGITAEKGCKLMEADYAGIEVHGTGWYSRDKVLLEYLHTPDSDMHRDQAQYIFGITPKEWDQFDPKVVKVLRFFAKNGWVFPQIYGSWYKVCAANIWKACAGLPVGDGKSTVKKWMGMSYTRFEERMRLHENFFWDTFKGVRAYQDSVSREYINKGYIETFLGFRYGGWLTRNNLYNYKIQGTAFHVLLWAMIQMHRVCKERGWRSRLMWQIYDSMIWNLWPPEQEEVVATCDHVMTVEAPKHFPWINTPLSAEFEITGVDGRFSDLKEMGESDNYEPEEE